MLVLFALLALWRVLRKGVWRPREQPVALTAGVIGVALLVYTAKLGGTLMFDHGLGIKADQMHEIMEQRSGEHHHHGEEEEGEHAPAGAPAQPGPAGADTAKAAAPADSGRTHRHADGTTHTHTR